MPYHGFLIWFKASGAEHIPPYIDRQVLKDAVFEEIQWLMALAETIETDERPDANVIPFRPRS